ncbi:MAG TPA: EF-P lysine aminoacylase EpmA [Patescibacteria group bacterium]|nr:EF-P lysine aminoacylase EpmA [Patescibacteria group bacterium]
MDQLNHLFNHRQDLDFRYKNIRIIREIFWQWGFTEVDVPQIIRLPGQEPYLSPVPVSLHNERGGEYFGYLHTSPEYCLKKMLAAGWGSIFYLGKCFRDQESFGGGHNPEFTMLEWYRPQADFYQLMEDVSALVNTLATRVGRQSWPVRRVFMRELWQEFLQVDLDQLLTPQSLLPVCQSLGQPASATEPYEDLFFRIFLNFIEPKLPKNELTIIHHYPLALASLARESTVYPGYAERFEAYLGGWELANAFSELIDPKEQKRRLEEEREIRKKTGRVVYDLDTEFIEALEVGLPPTAGIALGVDRLIMALRGCQNIDDVLTLPASKLF